MAEKYEVDPNNEKLLDAKAEGESIEKEYTDSMQSAIDANEQAKDDALGEIGEMGADGKWTEGTAIRNLADAQEAQTEFTIQKINEEKAQAQKDYLKEQKSAYGDYQRQIDPYGVNAERLAMNGLENSGYAESSQVRMYNQYQARITAARESYVKIMQDFSNQITAARLANSSTLAQIYFDAMTKRLELTTQFAFKNTELLTTMATQKAAIKQQNKQNYMSVYNSILEEMKLEENARQHDETLEARNAEFEAEMDYKNRYFEWQKAQANKSVTTTKSGGGSGKKTTNNKTTKAISDKMTGIKKPEQKETTLNEAEAYIDALIRSGAKKDEVAREISLALRKGALTQEQANKLRDTYTPRGLQY